MAKIEHFAIYAEDAPALKDFYVAAFEMKVIVDNGAADPPGYFLADEAGQAIEIIGRPKGENGGNTRWICHLAFQVEDFNAAKAALVGRGMEFETETVVETEGFRTAFFNDPAGNRCQIAWRNVRLGG